MSTTDAEYSFVLSLGVPLADPAFRVVFSSTSDFSFFTDFSSDRPRDLRSGDFWLGGPNPGARRGTVGSGMR